MVDKTSSQAATQLNTLLAEQELVTRAITNAIANLKKKGQHNYTNTLLRNRLQSLEDNWARCRTLHAQIIGSCSEEDQKELPYFTSKKMENVEDAYTEARDYFYDRLPEDLQHNSSMHSSSPIHHQALPVRSEPIASLPRIELPQFDGNSLEWQTFRDVFQSVIADRVDLPKVVKLQYLKSSLRGEASSLLKHVAITEANFDSAWQSITTRYENRRVLLQAYLRALFDIPPVSTDALEDLKALRDTAMETTSALKNLGRPVESWDDILVFLLVNKLDKASRKEWETKIGDSDDYSTFNQLTAFFSTRIRTLEALVGPSKPNTSYMHSKKGKSVRSFHLSQSSGKPKCAFCKAEHRVYSCSKFKNLSVENRASFVKRSSLCRNCLAYGHTVQNCSSSISCAQCGQRHHTFLHQDRNTKFQLTSSKTDTTSPRSSTEGTSTLRGSLASTDQEDHGKVNAHTAWTTFYHLPTVRPVLLATARVLLTSSNGSSVIVRALLDPGSQSSFINESIAQQLRLERKRVSISISGVNDSPSGIVRNSVSLLLKPIDKSNPIIPVRALVVKRITSYISPKYSKSTLGLPFADLALADPCLGADERIDFLLGADVYGSILCEGLRRGPGGRLTAQNTVFGWVLSGPLPHNQSGESSVLVHHSLECSVDSLLKKFWEIEEVPSTPFLTTEEKMCEDHFIRTHRREADGTYTVRLPFRPFPKERLGESKTSALSSLLRLEKRFASDKSIQLQYTDFLKEYENLGHMRRLSSTVAESKPVVYLPHHPVLREGSSTTKLRVVFNASCPTSTGLSLNDMLFPGPKLQSELASILLRWRAHRYVLTADIAKMFRQIRVAEEDQPYQCILWRERLHEPVNTFYLTTVTYGMTSAPFLAMRVIKQLLLDEGTDFPLAVPVLSRNIYVDDLLFGAEDRALILQTQSQVTELLAKAGFRLRKWASNSPLLLDTIDPHDHGLAIDFSSGENDQLKVLGISWNPTEDAFRFSIVQPAITNPSKRQILSAVSKIYDPLGWVSPSVLIAKILLQELWREKLGWDEPLSLPMAQRWHAFQNQLPALENISIPRWTGQGSSNAEYQLHGFADASSVAYAAAVYLRTTGLCGDITVKLLMAKTKVAPLKTISIPRLELCAASLLAKLLQFLLRELELKSLPVYCWTDSTITLAWLRKEPSHWNVFVANRVADIQSRLPTVSWGHVASDQNPADCASRGLAPSEIGNFDLWWRGPLWLSLSEDSWPKREVPQPSVELEKRVRFHQHHARTEIDWDLPNKFSSWAKLLRVTAYIMRFGNSVQRKPIPSTLGITSKEISLAAEFWVRETQRIQFPMEIGSLEKGLPVPSSSRLKSLSPFLDRDHILRLGGRLRYSSIAYEKKFPIILDNHYVTSLLIRQIHLNTLHGGLQLTLRVLREKYWVLGARSQVRKLIRGCLRCARERAIAMQQLMSDLPAARCTPSRPFSHTGVDYAGPFQIRDSSGRGHRAHKAYIALFVCLSIRAVHLELVHDYSTSAFLAAFDRFVARRGIPSDLYSDNGTNFQGSARELQRAFHAVSRDVDLQSRLATDGTTWHFIPPAAPHFGGLWEAGVKSVKHHLRRQLGSMTPTSEEFSTLLCQVESCLNSRPIAPLTDDPESYDALTPGHFLIGTSLKTVPSPSLLELKDSRLSRWQFLRKVLEQFWRQWANDYLASLQRRVKWNAAHPNLRQGELVLLKNVNLPPAKWDLGRITKTIPGPDGRVRVAEVATAKTVLTRPITQLCRLPISTNASQLDL